MAQVTTSPEVNTNPKASEPHPDAYALGINPFQEQHDAEQADPEVEAKLQQEAEGEDPAKHPGAGEKAIGAAEHAEPEAEQADTEPEKAEEPKDKAE